MLITTTFTSSKQVIPNHDCPSAFSSTATCKKSTSTSSHRGIEATTSVSSHRQSTAISSSRLPPLTPSEATTLNLFLRSSRSIAPLRIADIQGVIDETTGEQSSPAVRKGRMRTSSNNTSTSHTSSSGIQCCIIDSFPFDKCEIVATVVKKNAIYRQARPLYNSYDKGKGRAVSNDGRGDDAATKEEIQLIFYECKFQPSKRLRGASRVPRSDYRPFRIYPYSQWTMIQELQSHAASIPQKYTHEKYQIQKDDKPRVIPRGEMGMQPPKDIALQIQNLGKMIRQATRHREHLARSGAVTMMTRTMKIHLVK